MLTDKKFGIFDDFMADGEPEIEKIARRLRSLIDGIHPDAVEVPRLGEKTAAYGVGPKKMSEAYAYIGPHSKHVNLGFYYGTAVSDPEGMLEGTGKKLSHVKVRSVEEAEQSTVQALIEASIEERRAALSSEG